jgi:NAD(P)-dependent dehydrogenase (short-subunit alcohol dehydrogenase family)
VPAAPRCRHTKDGFEMHFGTNHMGHFVLTTALLDKMKAQVGVAAPVRHGTIASHSMLHTKEATL